MEETSNNVPEASEWKEAYQGENVKVYLVNGRVMVGRANFQGVFLRVIDERDPDKDATVNLSHVISISRL